MSGVGRKVKILAVGGGSGGHVTPVVAVLRELKKRDEGMEIRFWTDRAFGEQAKRILSEFDADIQCDTIVAGKLRRYHHLTFLQHFTVMSVVWPNLRDFFLVLLGTFQSIFKLIIWRPDAVFTKGGYVCLPVGWAARFLRIPLVIHDSDAHPGLTNRLLARHATLIATGAPLKYYTYPAKKTRYVGIPIDPKFRPFSRQWQLEARGRLGLPTNKPLTVVTGGGLGARPLNDAVLFNLEALRKMTSIVLISGNTQFDELRALTPQNDPGFQLHGFVTTDMRDMLGAADVVVSRAGATTLLELAALAKPTILVPNARLTGGHQTKNATVYKDADAVVLLDDERIGHADDTSFVDTVREVLSSPSLRRELAENIHSFAKPHAASDMAALILRAAGVKSRRTSGTIDHK